MSVIRKKLVIDLLAFEFGKSYGYQEYIYNLLEYFFDNRDRIKYEDVILVFEKRQYPYFKKYESRFLLRAFSYSSVYKRLLIQTLLPYMLNLNAEDLLFSTGNYSSLLKRSKHLLVVHDLLFFRKKLFPYTLMRIQRHLYMGRSIKLADKIIAISDFTKKDIMKHYYCSASKIEVVYNFFNFKKFGDKKLQEKHNAFLAVCSSAFHKNTSVILKAFLKYREKGGKYLLFLVGGLKNNKELYGVYQSLPEAVKKNIKIYSHISNSELGKLYEVSNAYISASLFEGLGMPVVEAMYYDLPVILSDLPVLREVSLNRGIYFNPESYDDLSSIMYDFSTHRLSIPKMEINEVLDKYSEKKTSGKYVEIINGMYE